VVFLLLSWILSPSSFVGPLSRFSSRLRVYYELRRTMYDVRPDMLICAWIIRLCMSMLLSSVAPRGYTGACFIPISWCFSLSVYAYYPPVYVILVSWTRIYNYGAYPLLVPSGYLLLLSLSTTYFPSFPCSKIFKKILRKP